MTDYGLPLLLGMMLGTGQTGISGTCCCCGTGNARTSAFAQNMEQIGNSGRGQISSGSESMDEIFRKASDAWQVPVGLLTAVARAESGFDPEAQSSCGAMGVMQLMPGTAEELGVTDPWNAEQNIMGGAKYLSQMLERYDNNIELALAAYNAGPNNVDKYGGVPPFAETQNYVRKVQEYMEQAGGSGGQTMPDSGTACSCGAVSQDGLLAEAENSRYLGEILRMFLMSQQDTGLFF